MAGGVADFAAFGGGVGSVLPLIQDTGLHNFSASSVKEYAYTEDKNFKFRPAMEDSKLDLMLIHGSLLHKRQTWK